jgi:hypothetical protein
LGKGDGTLQIRRLHNLIGNDSHSNLAPKLIDINRDGSLDIMAVASSSNFVTNTFTMNLNRGSQSAAALGFQVIVQNSTNRPIVIESSMDLQTWSPIATNTPAGDWSLLDTRSASSHRFYRTRQQ